MRGSRTSHGTAGASRGQAGAVTLDRLLDEYLAHVRAERGYSAHTVAAYRADLVDLIGFASERGVDDAAGIDLALLRDWLWAATERGLARTSIARRAASARGFTSWLHRRELIAADPGAGSRRRARSAPCRGS